MYVRLHNKPTVIDFSPFFLFFFLFNSALLSGTLRTIQRAACDGEMLTLRCPLGTAVSIQLAQYGRPAPGVALCSQQQHPPDPPALTSVDGNQLQQALNDTCTLTPQMQVIKNLLFENSNIQIFLILFLPLFPVGTCFPVVCSTLYFKL